MILGVDPSSSICGAALLSANGELFKACLRRGTYASHPSGWYRMGLDVWRWASSGPKAVHTVALEYPQIYTLGKGKGDPNNLFPTACVAQSIAALAFERDPEITVVHYLPREWKGTIDKRANTVRVRARLSGAEFARVEIPPNTCENCAAQYPASSECPREKSGGCLIHNTYDAIGIALKAAGRFEKHRVIPR